MKNWRRTLTVVVLNVALVSLALAVFAVHPEVARAASSPGWGWPLPGDAVVDRPFEPPASQWGAGHRGVDLRGTFDEPVLSAGPGRVTYAGLLAGRGVVVVAHGDGLRTTYEPVQATVSVGTVVDRSDVLGTLTTGHGSCRHDTVCLHWGLLRGQTYLDPLGLVVSGHLRLLPIDANALPSRDRDRSRSRGRRSSTRETSAGRSAERSAERGVEGRAARSAEGGLLRGAARAAVVAAPEVTVAVVVVGGTVWFLRRRHVRLWRW